MHDLEDEDLAGDAELEDGSALPLPPVEDPSGSMALLWCIRSPARRT